MNITKPLSLLLLTALFLSANSITVQLTGTSGIADSDGNYVAPYDLSLNGAVPVTADCYDFFHRIDIGDTWTAQELTLSQAVAVGQFSGDPNTLNGYELVGVLSSPLFSFGTNQQHIDLQHAIWNVFDPGTFAVDQSMASFTATAEADISTFNFGSIRYLEEIPGDSEPAQAFVIAAPVGLVFGTPEPGTFVLIGMGLGFVGVVRKRGAGAGKVA